jgi:hypothetical protein
MGKGTNTLALSACMTKEAYMCARAVFGELEEVRLHRRAEHAETHIITAQSRINSPSSPVPRSRLQLQSCKDWFANNRTP